MLSGTPASPQQHQSLLAVLLRGQQELDQFHEIVAGDMAEEIIRRPRQEVVQFVHDGLAYDLEVTGFEAVSHPTLGPLVEYIGCFPESDRRVRLGASKRDRRLRYVKLG